MYCSERYKTVIVVVALIIAATMPTSARATVLTFTSFTDWGPALLPNGVIFEGQGEEDYASGVAGETIANGATFDGLTYSFTAGPVGTLQGGIITDQFNSLTGLSLGGNQSNGAQFFFGGDSVTISFPSPISAVGVFFNVNLNSGGYELDTPVGSVTTDSTVYDSNTFVFDGLISSTPFQTITFFSNDTLGSYNIPDIVVGVAVPPVPEPSSLAMLFGPVLAVFGIMQRRRPRRSNGTV